MGLFGNTFRDQELGTFTRGVLGPWKGTMTLPGGREVEVRLPGSGQEPDPAALGLLRELPGRYAGLGAEIAAHLYDHYEPYGETMDADEDAAPGGDRVPRIGSPAEAWAAARAVRVIVESTAPSRLEIAFAVDWDEEHIVGATVEEWRTTGFSGSVGP
jgi:hypothetical protein